MQPIQRELLSGLFQLGDVILARRDVYFPSVNTEITIGEEWPLIVLSGPEGSPFPELADIRVAPLSDAVHMAAEFDLLCTAEDGPLGRPFVVELWNLRPMLVRNIDRRVSRLSGDAIARLTALYNSMVGARTSQIPATWRGQPIQDDKDPRLQYQRARVVAASFLSDPVDELLESRNQSPAEDLGDAHVWTSPLQVRCCRSRLAPFSERPDPFLGPAPEETYLALWRVKPSEEGQRVSAFRAASRYLLKALQFSFSSHKRSSARKGIPDAISEFPLISMECSDVITGWELQRVTRNFPQSLGITHMNPNPMGFDISGRVRAVSRRKPPTSESCNVQQKSSTITPAGK